VVAAGLVYVAIRYGVAELFKRYTVHRGMWHSIPAAATVGLLAFLLVSGDDIAIRMYKTLAVVLGFVIHLILDEIWSVDLSHARLKKSFGTALKFWNSKSIWSNVSCYAKLAALLILVVGDPYLMNQLGVPQENLPQSPSEWFAHTCEEGNCLWHRIRDGSLAAEKPFSFRDQLKKLPFAGTSAMDGAGDQVSSPHLHQESLPPASIPAPSAAPDFPSLAPHITAPPTITEQPPVIPQPSFLEQPPYLEQPQAETARRPFYYPPAPSPDRR
jgi:hypothetical protein